MKFIRYIFFLLVVVIVALEVILRLLGIHTQYNGKIDMLECYDQFIEFNSEIGYINKPGEFQCKIRHPNDQADFIAYEIKHNLNGSRYTGKTCMDQDKRKMHFYGCSVTWGHGVSDLSSFPYKVQSLIGDSICIENYGVGSYSTLQSYLLFEQNLAKADTPEIAVLDYGSFHDSRNIMSTAWKQAWFTMIYQAAGDSLDIKFPNFAVPYATAEEENLVIKYYTKSDMNIPKWRKHSAILDKLYLTFQNQKEKKIDDILVSKQIIERMKERCDALQIDFILCGIYQDEATEDMLQYFSELGYSCANIAVDNKDPEYNLLPYDGHLNDKANTILAQKFIAFYKNKFIP